MADLAALLTRRQECESRGQLILVTALALAAIFLGLAVIVNSAIFTENLATRSEDVESTEALEYRHSVTQYMGEVVAFANENNHSSYSDIEQAVLDGTRDAEFYTSVQQAESGAGLSLEKIGDTEGARIFQNDGSTFEDNRSNDDWTLVEDVDNTRVFRMNVTSVSGTFGVIADNGSEQWNVAITDTDLTVTNPTGTSETCSYSSLQSLDITAATVNGSPCPALIDTEDGESLRLADAFDDDYRIEFDEGDDIEGNYSLVVGGSSLDDASNIRTNRNNYASIGGPGSSPYVRPAMYSARFDLEYEAARVNYETNITVAPGESP